jgi:hypothetical protein
MSDKHATRSHQGTVPSERGSGTQRLADAPPQDSPAATSTREVDADQSVLTPLAILVPGSIPDRHRASELRQGWRGPR